MSEGQMVMFHGEQEVRRSKKGRRTKEEMDIKVAACPFCGGQAQFHVWGPWRVQPTKIKWAVSCNDCHAMTQPRVGSDGAGRVAELWNRRA